MATIKTERDAAKQFNGKKCKLVRAIVPADPSFNEEHGETQVIAEINGVEYQFYADEVVLDKGEEPPKPVEPKPVQVEQPQGDQPKPIAAGEK